MTDPAARTPTRTGLRPRPPGALTGAAFTAKCTRCLDCVAVCPVAILIPDDEGYPTLRDAKACGHCGLCADVCTHGAIVFTYRTRVGLKLVRAIERRQNRQ